MMDTNSGDTMRKVLRLFAGMVGVAGAVLAMVGVGAAIAGDKYLTDATLTAAIAVVAVVVLAGSVVAWWRPIYAAVTLLLGVGVLWVGIAGSWGAFWSAYQTAVQTSGAAENQFWTSGVIAVPSIAIGTLFIAVGFVLALFGHQWAPSTRPRAAAVS